MYSERFWHLSLEINNFNLPTHPPSSWHAPHFLLQPSSSPISESLPLLLGGLLHTWETPTNQWQTSFVWWIGLVRWPLKWRGAASSFWLPPPTGEFSLFFDLLFRLISGYLKSRLMTTYIPYTITWWMIQIHSSRTISWQRTPCTITWLNSIFRIITKMHSN